MGVIEPYPGFEVQWMQRGTHPRDHTTIFGGLHVSRSVWTRTSIIAGAAAALVMGMPTVASAHDGGDWNNNDNNDHNNWCNHERDNNNDWWRHDCGCDHRHHHGDNKDRECRDHHRHHHGDWWNNDHNDHKWKWDDNGNKWNHENRDWNK
jgi:hypothetical protein